MISSLLQRVLQDNPIVATGMGAISAAGTSADELWSSAINGICHAEWGDFSWGEQSLKKAICRAPLNESMLIGIPRAKKLDRSIQLALVAAKQAITQTGNPVDFANNSRVGLVVGTSRGPRTKWMESVETKSVLPSDAANSTIASVIGTLSHYFSITGPSFIVSATCASGAVALALAAQQILIGAADIMVVGGTDAPLNPMMIAQLEAAGVLGHHKDPKKTCRPFDYARNGLCLGEGAGFVVLESARASELRHSTPLATFSGWGTGTDNVGRASVDREGETLVQTMKAAMEVSHTSPEQIDYLNVHGTGTVMNDEAEAKAINKVFGESSRLLCSSTKPITGHCLGATPILEAILCIQALRYQVIPPNINCDTPEFSLPLVTPNARPAKISHAMSNSLGFWGSHASIVFSRVL